MMLASSVAEVVSLAAVLQFLAVLANPTGLWRQPLVQQWAPRLGIGSAAELLLPIALAFALAAIGSDLSCEAYRHTLVQPRATELPHTVKSLRWIAANDCLTNPHTFDSEQFAAKH